MRYYCAPMEGLTDAVFRREQARLFPGGEADRYFSPFVSPTKDNRLDPRKLRDLLPENNTGIPFIPQVMCRQPAPFLWFAGELAAMGYREMNLNLGCPSGTVVAKGKGAGFLRDPAALDAFFAEIFAAPLPLSLSVKTRLGVESPAEFAALSAVYNKYPFTEIILHPRVQKDQYNGPVRRAAFEAALPGLTAPVCYNGDLVTAADAAAFSAAHPGLPALMVGRGLVADPALFRELRGGPALQKAELQAFMEALYRGYCDWFGQPANAVRRMQGVWTFVFGRFDDTDAWEKRLRHVSSPQEYEGFVAQLFARLPLREQTRPLWFRP